MKSTVNDLDTIDMKEGFVPRKRKVYPLLREERGEVREFIEE